jgi:hypothetical protein
MITAIREDVINSTIHVEEHSQHEEVLSTGKFLLCVFTEI